MASREFKKLFLIRFFAYLAMIVGSLAITFEFGPVAGTEFNYRKDKVLGVKRTVASVPNVITSEGSASAELGPSSLGEIKSSDNVITPVSTDYGIVIEKINANAKVIADVDPANERQYTDALRVGVAEAKGSTKPGQNGNLFIFSHSADAPWNIVRYNAVFYLLRELTPGDRILVFYQGRRYDYNVFDKTIVDPTDVSFLINRYDKPVLTLQTCDPPGTLLKRLIIRAQLQGS
jgi:LPXTG-site transpeptidase (sortase) family protein